MKGETTRQNIQKQQLKVQRTHYRLDCIRTDYTNKATAETGKTRPEYKAIKNDLTLKDRVFKSECGYTAERDFNAALNLRDTNCYTVANS